MANSFVQTILDAETDSQSLSAFMSEPAESMVSRRLSEPVNPLNYFLDYLHGLELVYAQQTGVVNVNGVQVKAITQAVTDALNSAAIDNNTQVDTLVTVAPMILGQIARTQSQKNNDSVGFKDFGATGNGVDDDTTAINSTLAANVDIVSTNGEYIYTGDIDALYAKKPSGSGFIVYDGYKYPVKPEARVNHLWQGAFASWQMGHADSVSTVQRRQIPAGVTHARRGFASGVTVYHTNGAYNQHALKIARNNLTVSSAIHNVVINLTPSETAPLLGKKCTLMYQCDNGVDWSDTNITVKVQASKELMQPILRDDGRYTSGNIDLITKSHAPTLRPQSAPYVLTFDVPADAVQLSISIDIPFSGTAGNEDWVEFEGMCLAVSDSAFICIDESALSIQDKAATRYQASYQTGIHRGAFNEQGTMQAMVLSTATNYAIVIPIRFNPPMAHTPWFTFQAPTSGQEFRLLRKTSLEATNNTTAFGQAYDLNNKGVTVTNNAVLTIGERLICHWTAESLF